jgi:hypothetical protein
MRSPNGKADKRFPCSAMAELYLDERLVVTRFGYHAWERPSKFDEHLVSGATIAQGASVKAVQAQLGYASETVTLDRYGQPTGSRSPTPSRTSGPA